MAEQPQATERRETRVLYCKLTQAEFVLRATEFAKCASDAEALDVERKASAKDYKNRIGGIHARMNVLQRVVTERREQREVQCTWHADWASKSMLLRRDDTGEVVHARTMTSEEVQQGFDFTTDESLQLPDQTGDSEPLDA